MKPITDSIRLEILMWHLAEQLEAYEMAWIASNHRCRPYVEKSFLSWLRTIPHPEMRQIVARRFARTCCWLP